MADTHFVTREALEAGLAHIEASPKMAGTVQLIVRRPDRNEREVLESAQLDVEEGLVGDNWRTRGSSATADGSAHPDMQINIMNARVIELIAADPSRWALAGDQFFVDLDLSEENLPPGTLIDIGSAQLEITAEPHLGCKKFVERFGRDAGRFVNSKLAKQLKLRGVNAKVVRPGQVSVGDRVDKVSS